MLKYERQNGRCHAQDFLDDLQRPMQKKFAAQMDALTKSDRPTEFCNQQRFWPLHGKGKPLWEFKEHDHRLYCFRRVVAKNTALVVVLLYGWVKDKGGKTEREKREIEKALELYEECLVEFPEGGIEQCGQ